MSTTVTTITKLAEGASSRRTFLATTGAAGIGLAVAACGSSSTTSTSPTGTADAGTPAPSADHDGQVAALAASLEVLAVNTYKAALDAAGAGKLGTVPPAVATFATTAMGHHQAALEKWNGVITGAGGQAVTKPPADLAATVLQKFGEVKDVVGVAQLALLLEQTAADTYFNALPVLKSKDAIQLAGSIQIIDQQHQAILLYVLGKYPVPDDFQKGEKAYSPPAASGTPTA